MKSILIKIFAVTVLIIGTISSYFISDFVNNSSQDQTKRKYEIDTLQIEDFITSELKQTRQLTSVPIALTTCNGHIDKEIFDVLSEEYFKRTYIERIVYVAFSTDKESIIENIEKDYNQKVTIRPIEEGISIDEKNMWIARYSYPDTIILGYELYSDPVRQEVIDEILQTGLPGSTDTIRFPLPAGTSGTSGILAMKPVFSDGDILGIIIDVFSYMLLFNQPLEDFSLKYPESNYCVYIDDQLIVAKGETCPGEDDIYKISDGDFRIEVSIDNFKYKRTYLFYIIMFSLVFFFLFLCLLIIAINKSREDAIKNSDIKSIFISEISHEIRTPMNGIIGMTEIISDTLSLQNDKLILGYFSVIKSCSQTLLGIVNDVLDISKIESGMMTIKNTKNDLLYELTNNIKDCWLTYLTNNKKDIVLNLQTSCNIPKNALCDKVRIKQILSNIVVNSLKFTEKGKIDVRIFIKHILDKSYLNISVADTGIGIKQENIDSIFKPFEQLNYYSKQRGVGLGLNISRRLCQLMNGDISCTSEYGKGSVFNFYVEITELSSELNEAQNITYDNTFINNFPNDVDEIKLDFVKQINHTILIVDDIELNINILVKMIDQSINNVNIHTSLNGKDAIELSNKNKYSLILMDIHMPGVNGLEAALSISTKSIHNRNTPIVFISADLAMKDEKIKKAGGKFLLHKPISKKILNDTVQKYLNYN